MNKEKIIEKIKSLKKEKNAIVLAHCYQRIEIDEVADFVGDSLQLSYEAANNKADTIVFAGVSFMAETAKILSPEKKVLIPRPEAGCFMAGMITPQYLKDFKKLNPDAPVVCYVNSSALIKANSDICCTSSNAIDVVKSLNAKEVLFVPDRGLGYYVNSQLQDVKVIPFSGFCPAHMRVLPEDIDRIKQEHPNALVLTHPECRMEVIEKSDYVGSTAGIMNFAKESKNKEFIIVTEIGVTERLRRDYPDKKFIHVADKVLCENMKYNTLEDILISLENDIHEVTLEKELSKKAYSCIKRMMDF